MANTFDARIAYSVGSGGQNLSKDVEIVQKMLIARNIMPKGGVDKYCGMYTIQAIKQFQSHFMRKPDGLIEVNCITWKKLSGKIPMGTNVGAPANAAALDPYIPPALPITNAKAGSSERNVKAFLKLIKYAEHKRTDDYVYYILYGGGSFTDTTKHPNKSVTKWGHTSTAAGAYQVLYSTWHELKEKGVIQDFTPASQDIIARRKLKDRGALSDVESGKVESAIQKLNKEWTSLPGGKQSNMKVEDARKLFNQFLEEE